MSARPKVWRIRIAVAAFLLAACGEPTGPRPEIEIDLARPWVTTRPQEVGLDAVALDRAITRAVNVPRFRALLVARRGRLALEQYFGGADTATMHDVRSVTKSIVSALVGIAAAEGSLPDLDASIGEYLDESYALDDEDRRVTIRHLLEMTSGFTWNESGGPDYNAWILNGGDHVQYLLDRPHTAAAGTRWTYNSAAVHLLGVVLEEATGTSLAAFAEEHLFAPAGITAVRWEPLGRDHVNGGSGIDLRGRDLLRFGQLLLQSGRSGRQQIILEEWVRSSTMMRYEAPTTLGPLADIDYARLWWTSGAPAAGAYFAWGFGGQFIYIVPDLDLVVVATTDWRNLSAEGGAGAVATAVMSVIVDDVLAAVR